MVFSDLFFLFVFIPLFALCYLIGCWLDNRNVQGVAKQNNAYKNMMLVIFSLVFYAWGEPIYVFLMLICVYINYLSGLWIARSEGGKPLLGAGGQLRDLPQFSGLVLFLYH